MSASVRAPGLLQCLLTIMLMEVLPRIVGLRRTFSIVHTPLLGESAEAAQAALTSRTVDRLCTAAAFYPRRALCLEQSLALTYLLRRRGVAAQMRIGVQPRPFHAHAWVEVNGRALNEPSDLPLVLAPFALRV